MRILHVGHRYWPHAGGSERHLREIAERQAREGHAVTVYTTDAWDLELFWNPAKRRVAPAFEVHAGVTIQRFPVRHLPLSRVSFPVLRLCMTRISALPFPTTELLRSLSAWAPRLPDFRQAMRAAPSFDIVHGMNVGFEGLLWPALDLARRQGIPFVITPLIHLGEADDGHVRSRYTMQHQIALIAHADAVLAQTEIERSYLIARGIPASKIVKAGAGVNPKDVLGGDGARFRAKYGMHRPFVFSLGTAARDKGTFHLVEAMIPLWRQGVEVDLVIAGPPMDAFLRFYRRQPKWVQERCHVLGAIPEEDKRDLLAAGALLAMPSRTDSLGLVYLEAWLYGKPVIGALAGGVSEVIDDGTNGFLVPFGDVAALTDRLARLLGDPDLARRMGASGRSKVLECYTWDSIYPVVRDVFDRLRLRQVG